MKVLYNSYDIVRLIDLKPGECFRCIKGNIVYMKVYFKRIPVEENTQYAVNLEDGAVYPFKTKEDYNVIPLDPEVSVYDL